MHFKGRLITDEADFSTIPAAGEEILTYLTGFYTKFKNLSGLVTHVNSCQKYTGYINLHILLNI